MCSSTSWRERSSSARIARASAWRSGRSTPSTSTRRVGRLRRAAMLRRQPPAAGQLPGVRRLVLHATTDPIDAPDRAARAGEEVLVQVRVARCCVLQALPQAPGAVRDHHQPGRAAAAEHVPEAAREREQLARSDGASPRQRVEAAAGPPTRIGGTGERAQARVRAGAAVLERRGRRRRGRGRPACRARRRSCHSCSSPPCSSATSNGPTRSSAARRIVMLAPQA